MNDLIDMRRPNVRLNEVENSQKSLDSVGVDTFGEGIEMG